MSRTPTEKQYWTLITLEVEAEVALTHPEHDTITVEPGRYEVRRQREYADAGHAYPFRVEGRLS